MCDQTTCQCANVNKIYSTMQSLNGLTNAGLCKKSWWTFIKRTITRWSPNSLLTTNEQSNVHSLNTVVIIIRQCGSSSNKNTNSNNNNHDTKHHHNNMLTNLNNIQLVFKKSHPTNSDKALNRTLQAIIIFNRYLIQLPGTVFHLMCMMSLQLLSTKMAK